MLKLKMSFYVKADALALLHKEYSLQRFLLETEKEKRKQKPGGLSHHCMSFMMRGVTGVSVHE